MLGICDSNMTIHKLKVYTFLHCMKYIPKLKLLNELNRKLLYCIK